MNFSKALEAMKNGEAVAREHWLGKDIYVEIKTPDVQVDDLTEPYIRMTKGEKQFPIDLSCESIMAEDWSIVN